MRTDLSARGRSRKFASSPEFAEQRRFHVRCSRVAAPDRLETAVEGEFAGTLAAVQHHARVVVRSIAARFGVPAVCDVTDDGGSPVCSFTNEGGQ